MSNRRNLQISVVVPCFNGARFAREALDSIYCQTMPVGELIFIDDGSADSSYEIASEWSRSHPDLLCRVVRQRNSGVSAARNFGWAMAESDWIAFLDIDDVWYPDHNQHLAALAAGNDFGFVFGDADRSEICPKGERPLPSFFEIAKVGLSANRGRVAKVEIRGQLHTQLLMGSFIPTCGTLVRRQALERMGGFPVGRAYGEDRVAWLKLLTLAPAAYTEQLVSKVRYHDSNATHKSNASKQLLQRVTLLDELKVHSLEFGLDVGQLALVEIYARRAFEEYKYDVSNRGLRAMMSALPQFSMRGAQFSLRDWLRGAIRSIATRS